MKPDGAAQQIAWKLRVGAWAEVAHLPIENAIAERLRKSKQKLEKLVSKESGNPDA